VKEYLVELVRRTAQPLQARNVVREYLQARILATLQRNRAMIPLAFHGGTALRFLFSTPRYSEDLDFALEKNTSDYNLQRYLDDIRNELAGEGYRIGFKVSDKKTVHGAFVNVQGLLHELGLSSHKDETVAIKIEIDTNPPKGAGLTTTIVRRHVTLQLQHHDKPSLLSGKLHAVLQRPHLKGRDVFDVLWYLSDPAWPSPNFVLLNNALKQTKWSGEEITNSNWRGLILKKIQTMNFENVVKDVRPFLDATTDPNLLTKENLEHLLIKKDAD